MKKIMSIGSLTLLLIACSPATNEATKVQSTLTKVQKIERNASEQ